MGRPRTGELVRKRTSQGMTYAVRFSFRGQRHFMKLGAECEDGPRSAPSRSRATT